MGKVDGGYTEQSRQARPPFFSRDECAPSQLDYAREQCVDVNFGSFDLPPCRKTKRLFLRTNEIGVDLVPRRNGNLAERR